MPPKAGERVSQRLTRFCVLALSLNSLADAHGGHYHRPLRKTGGSFTSLFESAASRQQPFTKSMLTKVLAAAGPGDEWQDNFWPYREPTPWDISTDLPHPRKLEYDVQEGTWLRLDVHPTSGDIVFDIIGDLYCLPGSAINSNGVNKALPILTGVPHDTAPRFSPSGDRIVFTSDAELGVENLWVVPYKGCRANHAKRAEVNSTVVEEIKQQLAQGVKETPEQRQTRLVSEGRDGAQRITNETFRWVSGGRFHPSGSSVIGTKWYTSDRSLGAGEGWQYNVPAPGSSDPIRPGSGTRVVGRTLPFGWTVDDYGDQQIGPEQHLWYGNDGVIYSKNVGDESTYTYSKDVHKGIYSIFKFNITNGDEETLVDSYPGGASRPELSRDQRTLAFVRRVRDKQALVFKDLVTGTLTHVWHGLTWDSSSSWAPMGTYPSFAFTPKDDAVIIWAQGQIYRVPLATNDIGEKIPARDSPKPIKFTAHISLDLADVRKEKFDLVASETADTNRVLAFKELSVDDAGHRVVFQAAGKSYYKDVGGNETAIEVPTLHDAPYITPVFVPGSNGKLVTHTRWDDLELSTFELANLDTKQAVELTGLPLGRYFSPVLSGASGSVRVAWVKHDGDGISGAIIATSQPGLYVGNVNIASGNSSIPITNVRFVPSRISTGDRVYMRWASQSTLLIQHSSSSFTIDVDAGQQTSVLRATIGSELVNSDPSKKNVAFVELYHVYFTQGSNIASGEAVWAKPGNSTKGLTRLTVDGGHDLAWNADGTQLFWFLGPTLNYVEVSKLSECSAQAQQDALTFGIACTRKLVKSENVVVEHSTDIARLKKDAKGKATLAFVNANILPMGTPNAKVIRNGVITTKDGVITGVGSAGSLQVGSAAKVIDVKGAYILPGFLDVHAHWDGAFGATRFPAKSWELQTFLAHGVTTLQNPSADNVDTFWERSRLERGQFVGSRIFSVGDIIYGAGGDVHQEIVDMDQAFEALKRIRVEGGIGALAYKNYNLPSRAARQRLLLAARNVSILCVPEGGMNWDWDFTHFTDGMTTNEHSLPVPLVYDDVLTLIAKSGTAITPTHLVHYGGAAGEEYLWAHEDLAAEEKLRRFTPHDVLASVTESTARPNYSWTLFNTTLSMGKVIEKGGHVLIGAHGEPPLGRGYHEELFFTKSGGISNYEVLLAATSNAAKTFGLDSAVGSIEKGKLADLVVFQPGVDILKADITSTQKIAYVVRGGRVWNADTMEEVWPVAGRKQVMPIINPE